MTEYKLCGTYGWRLLVSLVLVLFCVAVIYTAHEVRQHPQPAEALDLSCAVIHRPTTGCPEGYEGTLRYYFIERDGRREFACTALDSQKTCLDYLRPGESLSMTLGGR